MWPLSHISYTHDHVPSHFHFLTLHSYCIVYPSFFTSPSFSMIFGFFVSLGGWFVKHKLRQNWASNIFLKKPSNKKTIKKEQQIWHKNVKDNRKILTAKNVVLSLSFWHKKVGSFSHYHFPFLTLCCFCIVYPSSLTLLSFSMISSFFCLSEGLIC
jgi:hypothetical protein